MSDKPIRRSGFRHTDGVNMHAERPMRRITVAPDTIVDRCLVCGRRIDLAGRRLSHGQVPQYCPPAVRSCASLASARRKRDQPIANDAFDATRPQPKKSERRGRD